MRAALREAVRVVKPGRTIVVIAPLARGSFFSVLRLAEDETHVRAAAQKVVSEALDGGTFEPVDRIDYLRCEHFADVDQFLTRIIAVEPARAPVVDERRYEMVGALRRYARTEAHGRRVLEQPMRAHVFAARYCSKNLSKRWAITQRSRRPGITLRTSYRLSRVRPSQTCTTHHRSTEPS